MQNTAIPNRKKERNYLAENKIACIIILCTESLNQFPGEMSQISRLTYRVISIILALVSIVVLANLYSLPVWEGVTAASTKEKPISLPRFSNVSREFGGIHHSVEV